MAVHGTGPNFDAIFFQSGPFQIVAYYPPVNVSNVYEEVWGQIGGKTRPWRKSLLWGPFYTNNKSFFPPFMVWCMTLIHTDWRDTLPTLPGTLVIRYKTPTWSGEYSVQDSFLSKSYPFCCFPMFLRLLL